MCFRPLAPVPQGKEWGKSFAFRRLQNGVRAGSRQRFCAFGAAMALCLALVACGSHSQRKLAHSSAVNETTSLTLQAVRFRFPQGAHR